MFHSVLHFNCCWQFSVCFALKWTISTLCWSAILKHIHECHDLCFHSIYSNRKMQFAKLNKSGKQMTVWIHEIWISSHPQHRKTSYKKLSLRIPENFVPSRWTTACTYTHLHLAILPESYCYSLYIVGIPFVHESRRKLIKYWNISLCSDNSHAVERTSLRYMAAFKKFSLNFHVIGYKLINNSRRSWINFTSTFLPSSLLRLNFLKRKMI